MIKGMYEFAFSVYTIKTNVTELGAREHAVILFEGVKVPSMFV